MKKERILTEEELNTQCVEWQKRLRLQDWDINVELCDDIDIFNGTTVGNLRTNVPYKRARIRVVAPALFPKNDTIPQDMLFTLLHELLELKLYYITDPETADGGRLYYNCEIVINHLATVLLDFYDAT